MLYMFDQKKKKERKKEKKKKKKKNMIKLAFYLHLLLTIFCCNELTLSQPIKRYEVTLKSSILSF